MQLRRWEVSSHLAGQRSGVSGAGADYPPATVPWYSSSGPNVEKLKRKRDAEGLRRALRYEDVVAGKDGADVDLGAPVREEAATALAELGGPASRQALVRTLDDPEVGVRRAGVRALGRLADPATADALIEAIAAWTEPGDRPARQEAVRVVARFGDPGMPQRLVDALLRRPEGPVEDDGEVLRELVAGSGSAAPDITVRRLMKALARAPDGPFQSRAAMMLIWLSPHSIDPLIEALGDPWSQRKAAAALGGTRNSRAIEPLAALLDSDDPLVRETAVWALGLIKDPSTVEHLLRATGDTDYSVRSKAAAGLDELGTVAVIFGVTAAMRSLPGDVPERADELPPPPQDGLNSSSLPSGPVRDPRRGGILRRLLERDEDH